MLRVPAIGSNAETVRPGSEMGSKTGGKQAICLSSATPLPGAEIAWYAHRRPVGYRCPAWRAARPGHAAHATALRANIRPLNGEKLAEIAVLSASAPAGAKRRDGISYLQEQKIAGW